MGVTIKDVAKKAKVSIATVSHVIHKTRYVSKEVTERVNKAIEELNYYPNLLVGSLRKKKTFTIGLIIPNISNETFGKLSENIQRILFEKNYNLIICNTANSVSIENAAIKTLLTKKVDGVIAIPTTTEPTKFLEIKNMEIPIVFIDRIISGFEVDSVLINNYKGTYDAISYLIKDLKHRHIGYIDRPIDHSHNIEQKRGYIEALKDNGITINEDFIVRAERFDYSAGVNAVKLLLKRNPELTAIFGYYDIIAMGAIRGAIEMGYKIPNDISIIGYDGMPFTSVSNPSLTTVKIPITKLANNVCNLLLKRLEKNKEKNVTIKLNPNLLIRESVTIARDAS